MATKKSNPINNQNEWARKAAGVNKGTGSTAAAAHAKATHALASKAVSGGKPMSKQPTANATGNKLAAIKSQNKTATPLAKASGAGNKVSALQSHMASKASGTANKTATLKSHMASKGSGTSKKYY